MYVSCCVILLTYYALSEIWFISTKWIVTTLFHSKEEWNRNFILRTYRRLTRLWLTQFLISDTINMTGQFLINYLFSNSDMSAHLCMMWMQKCIFKIKWQTLIRLEKPVFFMPALSKWHLDALCRGRYHAIETLWAVNCISKENQSEWDIFLRFGLYMKLGR